MCMQGWSKVLDDSFLLHPTNQLEVFLARSVKEGKLWFYCFVFILRGLLLGKLSAISWEGIFVLFLCLEEERNI